MIDLTRPVYGNQEGEKITKDDFRLYIVDPNNGSQIAASLTSSIPLVQLSNNDKKLTFKVALTEFLTVTKSSKFDLQITTISTIKMAPQLKILFMWGIYSTNLPPQP